MAVLVVADNDNALLRDATHKTVTAALKISGDVDVLVLGKGAKAVADQAAKIAGVRKVLLTSPGVRPYVRSIIERFRGQTVVMSQNEIHPRARLKTVGMV